MNFGFAGAEAWHMGADAVQGGLDAPAIGIQ